MKSVLLKAGWGWVLLALAFAAYAGAKRSSPSSAAHDWDRAGGAAIKQERGAS